MIKCIFEHCYTSNMYPERLKPLSRIELCKGMTQDAVERYLELVQQLYDSMAFDVNAKFERPSREELEARSEKQFQIYRMLIKHLFKQDAISNRAFDVLFDDMFVEFNLLARPDNEKVFVSDSLDDFRLSFERSLVENDPYIGIDEEYLSDRYGYGRSVRPEAATKRFVTGADMFIYREIEMVGQPLQEVSYWEVKQLLDKIKRDRKNNAEAQERIDAEFGKQKRTQSSFISSLRKTPYSDPQNISEWYTVKRALEAEDDKLWRAEDAVERVFLAMKKPDITVGTGASLYIYRGNIGCHKNKHTIVSATAILYDENDREIQLDVEYCSQCDRYILNYVSFEHYREQYGVLIGKLRMLTANSCGGEFDMAFESPLKLCGYNVSQNNGLSTATRQYLLAKIMHDGIMSKHDVIHYLERFININGAKKENTMAVEKWCEDLDFVHHYDMAIQPRVYISKIKKY